MIYLPIKGYEGLYEVSDFGDVRSLDRKIIGKDGAVYPFKGRSLRPTIHKDTGYLLVSLWKNGTGKNFYVHRLVAEAHIPNPLGLPEVNHDDGNRANSNKSNLYWVTGQQNKQHAVDTGLRKYTNKLTREGFIECLEAVIAGESYDSLTKRVPYQVPFLSTKIRKIAKELGREEELDASLKEQRAARARINGAKNTRSDRLCL